MPGAGTPYQHNWRICKDDAATPTSFWAAENGTDGVLVTNEEIVRVRLTCEANGGAVAYTNMTLQWSTDDTNFTTIGADQPWNYTNGAGTDNSAIATRLLTDSNANGLYEEDGTNSGSMSAGGFHEWDYAIAPTETVQAGQRYYFRLYNGAAVALGSGHTHPQITTAAAPPTSAAYYYAQLLANRQGRVA